MRSEMLTVYCMYSHLYLKVSTCEWIIQDAFGMRVLECLLISLDYMVNLNGMQQTSKIKKLRRNNIAEPIKIITLC